MDDKLMYDTYVDLQNHPFCRLKWLDTRLNEPTNQKFDKVFNKTNKKYGYKTLGTSVIYSPMSPLYNSKEIMEEILEYISHIFPMIVNQITHSVD